MGGGLIKIKNLKNILTEPMELIQEANKLAVQKKYDEAFEILAHAEELSINKKRYDGVAATYGTCGSIFFEKGEFKNAKEYFEKALIILEEILVPNNLFYNLWVARIQRNLGHILKMRNIEDAINKYKHSLAILEILRENDHSNIILQKEVISTLEILTDTLHDTGWLKESEKNNQQAIEMKELISKKNLDIPLNPIDIAGTLNHPNFLRFYRSDQEVDFDFGNFLECNQKLFVVLGIFGALTVYMNNLFSSNLIRESYYLGFGIVSSLLIFTIVSAQIIFNAVLIYDIKSFLSTSIGNFKRIIFLIPFSVLVLVIISYVFINLKSHLEYIFAVYLIYFELLILLYFYKHIERLILKFINKPKSIHFFIIQFIISILIVITIIIFDFSDIIFITSSIPLVIAFIYIYFRVNLFILDFGYYRIKYLETLIHLNRFGKKK